ncbi:hypothetical protein [Streptomyces sp. SAJ15]|uniref:hypothetical protein n=1 Tax=Streptomyces sp. SAJ15 TaxID=2011095 RepID=UPI001642BEE2|nr:hypothetical protein [Streptomyces sp. SAJ15]
MASSARHARHRARHVRPQPSLVQRALLRTGFAVSAAGAALGAGGAAATAQAAERAEEPKAVSLNAPVAGVAAANVRADDLQLPEMGEAKVQPGRLSLPAALEFGLSSAASPVKDAQPNPLANTPVDPLNNAIGTQIADFPTVSTGAVTGPLTRGAKLRELPLVGGAMRALPG